MIGLVMTGGGARGAYQAGVLKRIGEIPRFQNKASPFQILGGASAGAVNSAFMAAGSHEFGNCTQLAADLWCRLKVEDVFRTNIGSIGSLAGTWLRDLSLGGVIGGGKAQSLLDFSPLKQTLEKAIAFPRIEQNISEGHLYATAIAATNYVTGKSYIFIQGRSGHPVWHRSRRVAISEKISAAHVCASAAIPVVFQPVCLETEFGTAYFGDGCLRLTAPLSMAIRLGANRVLAIGVRAKTQANNALEQEKLSLSQVNSSHNPPLAQVLGVVLNAIFLDHLDADVEHLQRLNDLIRQAGQTSLTSANKKESIQIVEAMSITPSQDIGKIAEEFSGRLPSLIKYMMRGISHSKEASSDLMSYLLFDENYTRALVDLGYRDADDRIDEISEFLGASPTLS